MSQAPKVIVFAASAIILGAYFGYPLLQKRQRISESEDYDRRFVTGDIKLRSGPVLPSEDPKKLRLKLVDLGIGKLINMDDNGDVLYKWFGDKLAETAYTDVDGFPRVALKLAKPKFRLRRANGEIQDFLNATDVRLTRRGRVYEITGSGSEAKISFNGQVIIQCGDRQDLDYWDSESRITDDGIFSSGSRQPTITFDENGKVKYIRRSEDDSLRLYAASTELGTLGTDYSTSRQVVVFKNQQVTDIKLPIEFKDQVSIKPTKNSFYVYAARPEPTALYRFRDGKFDEMPLPVSMAYMSELWANSRDDQFLVYAVLDNAKKGRADFPYTHRIDYVSNGAMYDFKEALLASGIKHTANVRDSSYRNANIIDEKGNLALELYLSDYPHVCIIQRVK